VSRVSIVNFNGHVLLDSYVRPEARVTNFLTAVSGITPQRIKTAPTLQELKPRIAALLRDKVIVGHSIHNDFEALEYQSHPDKLVRDISLFSRYKLGGKRTKLQTLAAEHLQVAIQGADHNSVEDARAALGLYIQSKAQIDSELKFRN